MRGVSAENFAVRPEIAIVEGRLFTPGLREAIVGRSAQSEFEGSSSAQHVKLRDSVWTIVGVFTTGDATEAGLIMDVDTLASAYGIGFVNSVTARLESPAAFDALKAALDANPTLKIDVYREPDYYAQDAADLDDLFFFVTYVICSIMAAGALVGALNTMYAAVSSRAVEIATLRALGFGATGIVVSILVESLALAALGAVGRQRDRVADLLRRLGQHRRRQRHVDHHARDHAVHARHRVAVGCRRRFRRRAVSGRSRCAAAARDGAARADAPRAGTSVCRPEHFSQR